MTVATMTLRAARQRNVVLAVVGASMLVSLLLLSQTHSHLRRTEEDLEKCQQKHDSVAAQLTVLYEHKARLEKTLQAEIDRKKLVDDELKTMQSAISKEKMIQTEKLAILQRQYDEMQAVIKDRDGNIKNLLQDLDVCKSEAADNAAEFTAHEQKLHETNNKLEEEVRKMQQSVPIDMNDVERLRERVRQCDADQANRQAQVHRQAQVGQVVAPAVPDRPGDDRTKYTISA
ncbi:Golgi integral membrane protein 4-like [Tropilaelaps mercedesae]|uniref:Golgi integral membrane protein 4-like n=1 Tax=Tropilaelaps mercedesae TaxID=418985 RepID=A0A1V9XXV4_9ACAR|nr:Golgi integral membrane protein 4-like [Tropilaelaps mercedesae]